MSFEHLEEKIDEGQESTLETLRYYDAKAPDQEMQGTIAAGFVAILTPFTLSAAWPTAKVLTVVQMILLVAYVFHLTRAAYCRQKRKEYIFRINDMDEQYTPPLLSQIVDWFR